MIQALYSLYGVQVVTSSEMVCRTIAAAIQRAFTRRRPSYKEAMRERLKKVFAASFLRRGARPEVSPRGYSLTASRFCPSLLHGFSLLVLSLTSALVAQSALSHPAEPASPMLTASLPDSPGALLSKKADRSGDSFDNDGPPDALATDRDEQPKTPNVQPATLRPALPRVKFISAGRPVLPQKAHDKILLGLRETATPYSIAGWFLSSGWSHLIDGSPNYGVNSEAYAQRLGAAAALNASKEIFSDSVLATAFRQDPRYYQLGRTHKFFNRGIYAATRPIIGRTDGGKTIPNYAFILGTAGAAALTQTYYPDRNISGGQFARTWITSLGGSSLGYLVSEFGGEVLRWLHVEKHE